MKSDKISADDPRVERELRRREEIRHVILKAAEKIIITNGYTAMVMDDVAREAGLSKATLYKYVPSKGQILFEIVSYYLDVEGVKIRRIADSEARASEKLRAMIAEIVGFHEAKSDIARIMMMDRATFHFLRLIYGGDAKAASEQFHRKLNSLKRKTLEISKLIARAIKEGVASGEFRPVDPMETVFILDSLFAGANHSRLWQGGLAGLPADELSEKIFVFVYSSIRWRKGEFRRGRT